MQLFDLRQFVAILFGPMPAAAYHEFVTPSGNRFGSI
jgi:hypothetical protein